jgi:hypothetical protein
MSYNSKDSLLMDQQLKVQELCIRFSDLGLYEQDGADVSVDLGEEIEAIVCVIHCDNSGPTVVLNAAASNDLTDNVLTATLASNFAANDVLIIKYIAQQ